MTRHLSLALCILGITTIVACGHPDDAELLEIEDEITLTAISGPEEAGVKGGLAFSALPGALEADTDRPELFRACNAQAVVDSIVARYDANKNGSIDEDEGDRLWAKRSRRNKYERRKRLGKWRMLSFIYNEDDSDNLNDDELRTLLGDFDLRCEALHAQLADEFDHNGDGFLDDDEFLTAKEAVRTRHKEHRRLRASEKHSMETSGNREALKAFKKGDLGICPAIAVEFDTDRDGFLNPSERKVLRDTLRTRIQTGAPLRPRSLDDHNRSGEKSV